MSSISSSSPKLKKLRSKSENKLLNLPKSTANTDKRKLAFKRNRQTKQNINSILEIKRCESESDSGSIHSFGTKASTCYDKIGCIKVLKPIASGSYSVIYTGIRSESPLKSPKPPRLNISKRDKSNDRIIDDNSNDDTKSDKKSECELDVISRVDQDMESSNSTQQDINQEQIVAIKIINHSDDVETRENDLRSEIDILRQFRSYREIVQYIGIVSIKPIYSDIEISDCFGFSMKYYPMGDIYKYISSEKELTQEMAYDWIVDMTTAVSYLHNSDPVVLHRDIKTLNFLIDDDYSIKLGDFGLSRHNTETNRNGTLGNIRSSLMYSPPEAFETENYKFDTPSDIYSLTLSIWEIVSYVLDGSYSEPYKTTNPWQIPRIVCSGVRPHLKKELLNRHWISLFEKGWNSNPSERLSINDMLEILRKTAYMFTF